MSSINYHVTDKQGIDILNKIKSINLPEDKARRLFITFKSPVRIGYANRNVIESKFKIIRDLFTRQNARVPGFEKVGGIYVREYGEKMNGLHFHVLLLDFRETPILRKPSFVRMPSGEPGNGHVSDLETILKNKWMDLMKSLLDPETLSSFDLSKVFLSKPVDVDENGFPELPLMIYLSKADQKGIKIDSHAKKPRWYGFINERALTFKATKPDVRQVA